MIYYQCVIVTNGIRTYAIYIYPTGGITLQSLFQLRSIYMGHNAQDEVHQFNYYKSGTISIDQLDVDPSNTGTMLEGFSFVLVISDTLPVFGEFLYLENFVIG